MVKAFKDMIDRWNDFTGKSSVADFWLAQLAGVILEIILSIVPFILFLVAYDTESEPIMILFGLLCIALVIVYLFFTVAGLALSVRRIRDAGFPWWFLFFGLIPSIGWIALIVFWCMPSSEPRFDFDGSSPAAAPTPASQPAQPAAPKAETPKTDDAPIVDIEPSEVTPVESSETWTCESCGAESTGNFCPSCGAAKK